MEINHLRNNLLILFPVFTGFVLFIAGLLQLDFVSEEIHFDELAFGKETQSYRARYQGVLIHCNLIEDGAECIHGWERRGRRPVTLWLGNSQLHAINQKKEGDVTAVQLLQKKMENSGSDLIAFSEPNANLGEHYVLFQYLKSQMPIKTLLMPVVYDDTREEGVRDGLVTALSNKDVVNSLSDTAVGRQLLTKNVPSKDSDDLAGLGNTPQQIVELTITNWLEKHWSFWEIRPRLRGLLFTNLYRWRNSVFGITAQTKRKRIPARYENNIAALEALLESCVTNNIEVIVYIVPLRNDVETPYIPMQYAEFKKDIESLASKYGVVFADLEGLVPAQFWGRKDSTNYGGKAELDFMHFQAVGHQLLADAMWKLIERNHYNE